MELAAALHHSRGARPNETNKAPLGQNTASSRPGIFSEPTPRGKPAALLRRGSVAARGLALPVLAGFSGEAVDASSLVVLLQFSLAAQKQQEEEAEEKVREKRFALYAWQ